MRSGQPSGATSTFGRGGRTGGLAAAGSLGDGDAAASSFTSGIVRVDEVVLPGTAGLLAIGVSAVGRFTAGVSLVGRLGGGTLGLGTADALGLTVALAPTVGVEPVAPVFGGAGARVIGLVGARPIAGFAPGSCRTAGFASATVRALAVAAANGARFGSVADSPLVRSAAMTIACGDSTPHTPQNRDSAGTGDPQPRHGPSESGALADMRSRTPHFAQKLSSGWWTASQFGQFTAPPRADGRHSIPLPGRNAKSSWAPAKRPLSRKAAARARASSPPHSRSGRPGRARMR